MVPAHFDETVTRLAVATPTADDTTDATKVAFASATEGAVLFYTTDGETPTSESTRYTAPLTLANFESSDVIKVVAYKDGSASDVLSYTVS